MRAIPRPAPARPAIPMPAPLPLAMLCLLATAIAGLWLRPLTAIDETRYLAVAWEMQQSGNWLVPTKNFALYSDKPPLLFWVINLIWALTGVSEFTARLAGPIFGCLALWLTAVLGRRLWPKPALGEDLGGQAALALAGLLVFGLSASLTMFDVPLTVATLLGLIALERAGHADAGLRPWAGFGAALALGVLTKGPVILFHLLPAALLLPLWASAPQGWRRHARRLGFGLLVGLALIALWLVPAVLLGGPEYRAAILWRQSAGRLSASFAHARPWWFYLALLPAMGFPLFWSPALLRAFLRAFLRAGWRRDRGLILCAIWAGGAAILFSLTSGKQIHYLLPELPALALIAARLGGDAGHFRLIPAQLALALAALLAAAAGLGLLPLGRVQALFAPGLMLLLWAGLILTLCWLARHLRGFAGAMLLSLGVLLSVNLLIATTPMARIYSTHPMAARLAPLRAGGLAYLGPRYHAEFNFAARLTVPVAELSNPEEAARWLAQHPQGTIFGRLDQTELPWPPTETLPFRNRDWGLWRAPPSDLAPDQPPAPKSPPQEP